MRRWMVVLGVAVFGLVLPAGAAGAPGLTPEVPVSPGGPGVGPMTAAMSPNGHALLLWAEGRRLPGFVMKASVRPPGGAWSAPETLGGLTERKLSLSASIADNGAAAVAFAERGESASSTVAVVASRAPGGPFAAAEAMTEQRQGSPRVGVDGGGTVSLVYQGDGDSRERRFAAGTPALAAPPATLQAGCTPGPFDVAPSGDGIASFVCGFGPASVRFAQRRGGAWQPPLEIPGSGAQCPTSGTVENQQAPEVTIGADGDVAAAYTTTVNAGDCAGTTTSTSRLTVLRGAGLTPEAEPVATVTVPRFDAALISSTELAIRPGGLLVGFDERRPPEAPNAQTVVRDLPGAPEVLGGVTGLSSMVGSPSGHALLIGSGPAVDLRSPALLTSRLPGTPFAPAAEVAPGADVRADAVAISASGDGIYASAVYDGTATSVRARGFDVSAPAITAPPAVRVAAGRTSTLPVNVTDLLGPVTVVGAFGDGTPEVAGFPVRHRFAKAGTYQVAVRAVDAVANESSAALTVRAVRVARLSGLRVRPERIGRTTRVRYRLDRRSRVRIALQRRVAGRKVGTACVAPTDAVRANPTCVRWVTAQRVTRRGRKGVNRTRVRVKRLPAGRYRIVATPVREGVAGGARRTGVRIRRR